MGQKSDVPIALLSYLTPYPDQQRLRVLGRLYRFERIASRDTSELGCLGSNTPFDSKLVARLVGISVCGKEGVVLLDELAEPLRRSSRILRRPLGHHDIKHLRHSICDDLVRLRLISGLECSSYQKDLIFERRPCRCRRVASLCYSSTPHSPARQLPRCRQFPERIIG